MLTAILYTAVFIRLPPPPPNVGTADSVSANKSFCLSFSSIKHFPPPSAKEVHFPGAADGDAEADKEEVEWEGAKVGGADEEAGELERT